jgi:hypothetical protein
MQLHIWPTVKTPSLPIKRSRVSGALFHTPLEMEKFGGNLLVLFMVYDSFQELTRF